MSSDATMLPARHTSTTIPLCVPNLAGQEAAYVAECVETNFVSSVGPFVDRFEEEFASYVGLPSAVAAVNGTSALHIALLVAGVQPGDEVLVSTLTFIAPVNAIRYANAVPVFIDAEPTFWQMDTAKAIAFLEEQCDSRDGALWNKRTGRRVRAIMPVHILGHPVNIDPLLDAARRYGLLVVEDASESLGASYKGRVVGTLGDIAAFSFNGNKLITTGGGGMVVTRNADWSRHARYLTTQAKDDPIEFVHGAIGYNYRLPNLLAALGCAQLEQIDAFLATKRRIARRYTEALAEIDGLTPMTEAPWASSAYWLFTVLIDEGRTGVGRRELMHVLDAERIQTRPLWQPAHQSPAHRDLGRASCPVADELQRTALSLPSSTGLTDEDQDRVIDCIRGAIERARRS